MQKNGSDDRVPVVVFDRNDTSWIFRDAIDAADWMEAVDVIDGEYHAYDAKGYVLSFSVVDDRVLIRRTVEQANDEAIDQLRASMSESQFNLTADTLEGMLIELLDREESSGMKGVFSTIRKLIRWP